MKTNNENTPPIVFIAFANTHENHLRGLSEEESMIRQELKSAEQAGICKVIYEGNATVSKIYNRFQEYQGKIALFHYGGHANSYQLLLEAADGTTHKTQTKGLVDFLGRQTGLQSIFLNGCSTEEQAIDLIDAGVPMVIGTTEEIDDNLAKTIAGRFYSGIGNDLPIWQAWKDAESLGKDEWNNKNGNTRGFGMDDEEVDVNINFPWRCMIRDGQEKTKQWSLSLAANDPYFGLPPIPDKFHLPESPFRYLDWFEREHAEVFFGRGHYIKKLFNLVSNSASEPVILLYGQTGVGKSSLLEAGLLPRLEEEHTIYYKRHQANQSFLEVLLEIFQVQDQESLRVAWKKMEEEKQQPIHIILDQLEETITRPSNDDGDELEKLLNATKEIFYRKDEQPKGKLIFSYRKEYHPEILEKIRDRGIPKIEEFIQPINKQGIMEAIDGLTRSEKTQAKYQLEIEDELTTIIADDLLEDKVSSIAPVLQILLSKMWDEVKNKKHRFFSIELYQSLKKEGYLLADFLKEKLKELEEWNAEAVQSGLVLDLLYFHTTSKGTANKQIPTDISERYNHWENIIEDLLKEIKSKYLLTDTASEKRVEEKTPITLAHDTLAPLVREMFEDSNLPGQQASRIFKNKKEQWKASRSDELLTAEEIKILAAGKKGMKDWDDDEENFFISCKEKIESLEKSKKRIRLMLMGSLVAVFLLAIFGYFSQRQKNRTLRTNMLMEEGQNLLLTNPTQALKKFESAADLRDDTTTQKRLIDVKRDYVFYDVLKELDFNISKAAFSSDGKYVAVFNKKNETEVLLYDLASKENNPTVLQGTNAHAVSALTFSPDNKKLLIGSQDRSMYLWDVPNSGNPQTFLGLDSTAVEHICFSSDGARILSRDENYIRVWNANAGNEMRRISMEENISAIAFHNEYILTGSEDGMLKIIGNESSSVIEKQVGENEMAITAITSSDNKIITGLENGDIKIWEFEQGQLDFIATLVKHQNKIKELKVSNDKTKLLSSSEDRTAIVWNLEEHKIMRTLIGHDSPIGGVQFTNRKNEVHSCSEKRILKWKLPYDLPIGSLEGSSRINDLVLSKSRGLAIAATNQNNIDTFNFKNFQIGKFAEMENSKVKAIAISKNEKHLAYGSNHGEVAIMQWNGNQLVGNKKVQISDREIKKVHLQEDDGKVQLFVQSFKNVFKLQSDLVTIDTISKNATTFEIHNNKITIFSKDSTATVKDINSLSETDTHPLSDNIKNTYPLPSGEEFVGNSKRTVYLFETSDDSKIISKETGNIRSVIPFQKESETFLGILTKEQILIRNLNGFLMKKIDLGRQHKISKIYSDSQGQFIIGLSRSDIYIWQMDF